MQTIYGMDGGSWADKIQVWIRRSACFAVILLVAAATLYGQESTATFGGRVFDAQSRVVPKATVTVTSVESGTQWKSVTNNDGDWRVDALPTGHYRFQVVASGFKTLEHSAIELQVSDQKFVDTKLDVGTVTETIAVYASTPLVDTTSAVSGVVVTTAELEDLPSISNSPTALSGLTPGVVFAYSAGGGAPHLWSNIAESAIQVDFSGSGTNAVNYQIEGSSDTNNSSGQVAFIPPMEALSEERITKN
ncbi:MAG TPA: carboxypeptidase-like regulatory domain-containing protein, partial [Acidobacteriaceae bacterium]|nr:carboxypeptidase-like regulatory domain-containing protein [Acidobacteriaceae bacterium]